jgi:hypothetical protein
MRQLMILPHDHGGDGTQQLTCAACSRSSRNLMTSTSPPAFLGTFVNHNASHSYHRLRVFVNGMSLLSYTVELPGIQRQVLPCPFSGPLA